MASVLALAAVWFWLNDALADLIDVQFVFNPQFHLMNYKWDLRHMYRGVLGSDFYLNAGVYAFSVVGFVTLARTRTRHALTLLSALAAGGLCIVAQGKYYLYHWLVVLAPMAMLCTVGVASLWRRFSDDTDDQTWSRLRLPARAGAL